MTKHSLAFGYALVLFFGTVGLWRIAVEPRIHTENYLHIRRGMSQAEVEELLGGPPGNYGSSSPRWTPPGPTPAPPLGSVERVWRDDSNRIAIQFDIEGRVVGHYWQSRLKNAPTDVRIAGHRIRRWLGL